MESPRDDNLKPDNDYMCTVTTCRCLVVQTLCSLSLFSSFVFGIVVIDTVHARCAHTLQSWWRSGDYRGSLERAQDVSSRLESEGTAVTLSDDKRANGSRTTRCAADRAEDSDSAVAPSVAADATAGSSTERPRPTLDGVATVHAQTVGAAAATNPARANPTLVNTRGLGKKVTSYLGHDVRRTSSLAYTWSERCLDVGRGKRVSYGDGSARSDKSCDASGHCECSHITCTQCRLDQEKGWKHGGVYTNAKIP